MKHVVLLALAQTELFILGLAKKNKFRMGVRNVVINLFCCVDGRKTSLCYCLCFTSMK